MELNPVAQKFILHWGEMGTRWGAIVPDAEEIAETLGVARSNVSTSLKELQNWKLVKVAHILSERRDHFETSPDV